MSDQSGAQEGSEVRKCAEGFIYVGLKFHTWVHRNVSRVVQIIFRNIIVEMFQTESIRQMCGE